MSLKELKDKLEIGLKPDAPFRPDNLPDFQRDDPACKTGATPGNAPEVRRARKMCDDTVERKRRPRVTRPPRRRT
jgi:hypothetical protein